MLVLEREKNNTIMRIANGHMLDEPVLNICLGRTLTAQSPLLQMDAANTIQL